MASFWVILVIYSIVSTAVFYLVYNASQLVIDEEFHLRQGREYCDFNFHIVSVQLVQIFLLVVL